MCNGEQLIEMLTIAGADPARGLDQCRIGGLRELRHRWGGGVGLLQVEQEIFKALVHIPGLLPQFRKINGDPGHGGEGFEHRERGLGKWQLRENVRHFPEQASAAHSVVGRDSQQDSIETADVTLLEHFQLVALKICKTVAVDRRTKHSRFVFGTHRRSHRSEREHALHAKLAGVGQKLRAKLAALRRRLRLTHEHDQIVPFPRVVPQKQPTPGQPRGLDQSALDLHSLEIEKLAGRILC